MFGEMIEKGIITSEQFEKISEYYQEKKKSDNERLLKKREKKVEEADDKSFKNKRSTEEKNEVNYRRVDNA